MAIQHRMIRRCSDEQILILAFRGCADPLGADLYAIFTTRARFLRRP